MRAVSKDIIRLAVLADDGEPAEVEIRVRRDRFGGWETRAVLHEAGGVPPTVLGRVFRSQDRRLTVGKMIAWVRGRYRQARPRAERARKVLPAGGSVV
ncbi:MAG: hypothetical protein ACREH6_04160 [Geminicoccaceae bacterium]